MIFLVLMYTLMPVMGLILLIPSLMSRRFTYWTMKSYTKILFWLLYQLCGTRCEMRGPLPTGPCIVASKHQSFLDVMMLMRWLPEGRYVIKRTIMWAPVLGIYAMKLGSVPIDRGQRGAAMRSILKGLLARPEGQFIIFPQGTRVPAGETRPYKGGVVKLRDESGLPVELVATNTGWFWPRTGLRRSPGTAVIEFLGPLDPGIPTDEALQAIETRIETASEKLAQEAATFFAVHS